MKDCGRERSSQIRGAGLGRGVFRREMMVTGEEKRVKKNDKNGVSSGTHARSDASLHPSFQRYNINRINTPVKMWWIPAVIVRLYLLKAQAGTGAE